MESWPPPLPKAHFEKLLFLRSFGSSILDCPSHPIPSSCRRLLVLSEPKRQRRPSHGLVYPRCFKTGGTPREEKAPGADKQDDDSPRLEKTHRVDGESQRAPTIMMSGAATKDSGSKGLEPSVAKQISQTHIIMSGAVATDSSSRGLEPSVAKFPKCTSLCQVPLPKTPPPEAWNPVAKISQMHIIMSGIPAKVSDPAGCIFSGLAPSVIDSIWIHVRSPCPFCQVPRPAIPATVPARGIPV